MLDDHQDRHLFESLDQMWSRLQGLTVSIRSIDRSVLGKEDIDELEAIERLNAGFAYSVLEMNSMLEDGEETPPELIEHFKFLVSNHCDDCSTAISMVLREQSGEARQPVRVA